LWGIVVAGSRHRETHFLVVNFRLPDAGRHTLQVQHYKSVASLQTARITTTTYYMRRFNPSAGSLFTLF